MPIPDVPADEGDKPLLPPSLSQPRRKPTVITAPTTDHGGAGESPKDELRSDEASEAKGSQNRFALLMAGMALAASLISLLWVLGLVPIASVGKQQLKDGAVDSAKVQSGSLSTADFGGKLPKGAPGRPGIAGAKGERGPSGASGVSSLDQVTKQSVSDKSGKTVQVGCKRGTKVLGGGAAVVGTTNAVALIVNGPTSDGWQATATPIGKQTKAWKLSATAICAKPSSPQNSVASPASNGSKTAPSPSTSTTTTPSTTTTG
jgi:hypothetical protein